MNPPTNETYNGMPSWYDPFQEIRTMPKGWNLSSLLELQSPKSRGSHEPSDPNDEADLPLKPTSLP